MARIHSHLGGFQPSLEDTPPDRVNTTPTQTAAQTSRVAAFTNNTIERMGRNRLEKPEPPPEPQPPAPPAEKSGGLFGFLGGIVSAFGSAVSGVARAMGQAATAVTNFAGNAIAGVFNAAGSVVSGLANFVGGALEPLLPGAKALAARLGDSVRSMVSGFGSAFAGVVKGFGEAARDLWSSAESLLKGDFAGAGKHLLNSVTGLVRIPVDYTLMMLGRGVSAVQTLAGFEAVGEPLTAAEIAEARKVYGDSIDYSQVRLKRGAAGVFSSNDRPFAHGNTVYMKNVNDPASLIHELAHVWQHQHGGTDYMTKAVIAQTLGDGYDWKGGLDQGKRFKDLNPEQQAELLKAAYASGYFDHPQAGFIVGGTNYTALLEEALDDIHAGRNAP